MKALVIKGADFSNSCFDVIPLDGTIRLTKENLSFKAQGYFYPNNHKWSGIAGSTQMLGFWVVPAGKIIVGEPSESRTEQFGLCSIADNGNPDTEIAIATFEAGATGRHIFRVPSDCYVFGRLRKENEQVETDVPGFKAMDENLFDFSVAKDNYVLYGNFYIANGGWTGNGDITRFYNVLQGQKVTVTASSSANFVVAFFNSSDNLLVGDATKLVSKPSSIIAQSFEYNEETVKRIVVQAGETVEITAPVSRYLMINTLGESLDIFPESVVISNPE